MTHLKWEQIGPKPELWSWNLFPTSCRLSEQLQGRTLQLSCNQFDTRQHGQQSQNFKWYRLLWRQGSIIKYTAALLSDNLWTSTSPSNSLLQWQQIFSHKSIIVILPSENNNFWKVVLYRPPLVAAVACSHTYSSSPPHRLSRVLL